MGRRNDLADESARKKWAARQASSKVKEKEEKQENPLKSSTAPQAEYSGDDLVSNSNTDQKQFEKLTDFDKKKVNEYGDMSWDDLDLELETLSISRDGAASDEMRDRYDARIYFVQQQQNKMLSDWQVPKEYREYAGDYFKLLGDNWWIPHSEVLGKIDAARVSRDQAVTEEQVRQSDLEISAYTKLLGLKEGDFITGLQETVEDENWTYEDYQRALSELNEIRKTYPNIETQDPILAWELPIAQKYMQEAKNRTGVKPVEVIEDEIAEAERLKTEYGILRDIAANVTQNAGWKRFDSGDLHEISPEEFAALQSYAADRGVSVDWDDATSVNQLLELVTGEFMDAGRAEANGRTELYFAEQNEKIEGVLHQEDFQSVVNGKYAEVMDILNADPKQRNEAFWDLINSNLYAVVATFGNETNEEVNLIPASEGIKFMTDEERAIYLYLYSTEGEQAADEYLDSAAYEYERRRQGYTIQEWENYAHEHPVWATFAAMGMHLVSGVGLVDAVVQNLSNVTNPDSYQPVNYSKAVYDFNRVHSTVTNTVGDDIDKKFGTIEFDPEKNPILADLFNGHGLGDVYMVGTSAAETGIVMLLGAAGVPNPGILLASASATDSMLSAVDRGATDGQALALGVSTFLLESVTEELPIDSMLGGVSQKTITEMIMSQGKSEMSEELISSLGNVLFESVIMAEKSDVSLGTQRYMEEENLTEKEAHAKAVKDKAMEIATEAITSYIMGGVMGAAGKEIDIALNADTAQTIRDWTEGKLDNSEYNLSARLEKSNLSDLEKLSFYEDSSAAQTNSGGETDVEVQGESVNTEQSVSPSEPDAEATADIPQQEETTAETESMTETEAESDEQFQKQAEDFTQQLQNGGSKNAEAEGTIISKVSAKQPLTAEEVSTLAKSKSAVALMESKVGVKGIPTSFNELHVKVATDQHILLQQSPQLQADAQSFAQEIKAKDHNTYELNGTTLAKIKNKGTITLEEAQLLLKNDSVLDIVRTRFGISELSQNPTVDELMRAVESASQQMNTATSTSAAANPEVQTTQIDGNSAQTNPTEIGQESQTLENDTIRQDSLLENQSSDDKIKNVIQLSLDNISKEILHSKPPYSPTPKKWLERGGKISVEDGNIWRYTNAEGISIRYKNGYPDFKEAGLVIREVELNDIGSYWKDFAQADSMSGFLRNFTENTWHHHENMHTLQEIPRKYHREFTHVGGMSLKRRGKNGG